MKNANDIRRSIGVPMADRNGRPDMSSVPYHSQIKQMVKRNTCGACSEYCQHEVLVANNGYCNGCALELETEGVK